MTYMEGYVLPLPKGNIDAYKDVATIAKAVWLDHGALSYVEAIADDVPKGETTDFYRAVKCEENETVVFAFATFKSREARDTAHKNIMADPRMEALGPQAVPFDGKRMIFGGFEVFMESWPA